jgi:flagellar basal body-associated protein FliL
MGLMVKRILGAIIAAFTSPFALAFYGAILLAIGLAVGWFVNMRMEEAEMKRKAAERAALEAALRGPLPPQLVPDPPQGEDPFAPAYITLGDEILSNLPGRRRALITEIEVMTQRGPDAVDQLRLHRLRLRALTLGVLSELSVEEATRPDAPQQIADRLKRILNDEMRGENYGVNLIDQVYVKRLFVQ